jgi:DNA-binding transcriptional LysR family regulator
MLDVRKLRVLCSVVTSGSISAAAANLGYTPSAVSQQVAALEREAGVALLEKAGRGVRPTAAGNLLAEHAADVMARLAAAETALADLRAGRTGRLRVHYFATAGAELLPPAVAEFRSRRPGAQLELRLREPAYTTAQGFVAAGLGVTMVPVLGLGSVHSGVEVRRVRHPEPVRCIYAAIPVNTGGKPLVKDMLAALVSAARGR